MSTEQARSLARALLATVSLMGTAIGLLVSVGFIELIWPDVIPFTFFEFWVSKSPLSEAMFACWPIFLWAIVGTLVIFVIRRKDLDLSEDDPMVDLLIGTFSSIKAGVLEEIIFRWLLFYNQIVAYKIANWMFFGLMKLLYLNITGPLVNGITLGKMEFILFAGVSWAVGAAVVTSNGKFQEGHAYLGWVGYINSWFLGMFMFWLMFQYGLVACIVAHVVYDLLIHLMVYLLSVAELSARRNSF